MTAAQSTHHIAGVHIDDHQGATGGTLQAGQLAAHLHMWGSSRLLVRQL
jgi:hypothetical protein